MKEALPFSIIILVFVLSALAYPTLPERIPIHWNAHGVADGFSGRASIFFTPIMMVALYLLLFFLPKTDPGLKHNNEELVSLRLMFMLFFAVIWAGMLGATLGKISDISIFFIPALAGLFFWLGSILPSIKRNFVAGIRFPWTLRSDKVWVEVHKRTGLIMRIIALAMLPTLLIPRYSFFAAIILLFGGMLIAVIDSYFVAKRLKLRNSG